MEPGEHIEQVQQTQEPQQARRVHVPIVGERITSRDVEAPQAQRPGEIREPTGMSRNELTRYTRRNGLGAAMARSMEQRAQASAPAPAPSPQQSQADALQTQLNNLTGQVQTLVSNMTNQQQRQTPQYDGYSQQYGNQQYGQDDQLYPVAELDPANYYDPLDPVQRLQHRTALDAHVKGEVQRAVEADRAARQLASDEERYRADIAATQAKYGRDANFAEVQAQAAQIVIASGGKVLLEEAYKLVSDDIEARSGRRGTSYMPKEVKGLGAIAAYNRETGRAGRTNKKGARW